jgi:hypothetical protein
MLTSVQEGVAVKSITAGKDGGIEQAVRCPGKKIPRIPWECRQDITMTATSSVFADLLLYSRWETVERESLRFREL